MPLGDQQLLERKQIWVGKDMEVRCQVVIASSGSIGISGARVAHQSCPWVDLKQLSLYNLSYKSLRWAAQAKGMTFSKNVLHIWGNCKRHDSWRISTDKCFQQLDWLAKVCIRKGQTWPQSNYNWDFTVYLACKIKKKSFKSCEIQPTYICL